MSDLNPPGQNNKSCMLRMPMFIFLVSRTSIKFQRSIDKKTIYALWWPTRTEVTLTNLALDRIVCLIRIRSRMVSLLCSLYILHYIEFSPWNLQFKRSDLEREYNKHKIDSLWEERLSLEVFCVCFIKRELACTFTNMSHQLCTKDNALYIITLYYLTKQSIDDSLQLVFTTVLFDRKDKLTAWKLAIIESFTSVFTRNSDSNRTI